MARRPTPPPAWLSCRARLDTRAVFASRCPPPGNPAAGVKKVGVSVAQTQQQVGAFSEGVQIRPAMRAILQGKLNANVVAIGNIEGHSLSAITVDEHGQITAQSLTPGQSDLVVNDPLYRPIPLQDEQQRVQQAQRGSSTR